MDLFAFRGKDHPGACTSTCGRANSGSLFATGDSADDRADPGAASMTPASRPCWESDVAAKVFVVIAIVLSSWTISVSLRLMLDRPFTRPAPFASTTRPRICVPF